MYSWSRWQSPGDGPRAETGPADALQLAAVGNDAVLDRPLVEGRLGLELGQRLDSLV